jgi:hypothetical protein
LSRSFGANRGGHILSFGKADHGKLGHGDAQVNRAIPTVVESMQGCNIVKVASMSTYAVVVDAEGGVYVWGTGKNELTTFVQHDFMNIGCCLMHVFRRVVGEHARASYRHRSSAPRGSVREDSCARRGLWLGACIVLDGQWQSVLLGKWR